MRKLTILFALLTLSAGLWAAQIISNVDYIDANGQRAKVSTAFVIEDSSPLQGGWYIVAGTDVQTGSLVCSGEVHLILADGAKLTAIGNDNQAGIVVSGVGNSLTIYGQTAQSGQLIARGGKYAAGIGGGHQQPGSNITINGGVIIANGGNNAAGIGGGDQGDGSNIIINGGKVIATGNTTADGIGGGNKGSGSSNIFVATNLIVKAGDYENPTDVIENNGGDLANGLAGKRYVTIEIDLTPYKTDAIGEIDSEIEGVTDETMLAIATAAKTNIGNATTIKEIDAIKTLALAKIDAFVEIQKFRQGIQNTEINTIIDNGIEDIKKAATTDEVNELKFQIWKTIRLVQIGKEEGIEEGKAAATKELLGEMGDECTDCTAVKVSDGETTITLYNAKTVDYEVK